MEGGGGDDTYRVDNAGDVVIEAVNGGIDTVIASVSYTLRAGAAVETMTTDNDAGTAAINLTGNELANRVVGNAGANTLHGGAGNDRLEGLDGSDILWGDAGQDLLIGGAGNDVYVVTDVLDTILETATGGTDTLSLSLAGGGVYTLANHVETMVVAGTATEAHGNGADNRIVSTGVGNILYGEGGNDTLIGSATADTLYGGTGNDTLRGMDGHDTLYGGTGNDVFVFAANAGSDWVGDFTAGSDRIDLSALGFTSFAQVQAAMSESGGDTRIELGGGNSVTLDGVAMASLGAGDFGMPESAPLAFASMTLAGGYLQITLIPDGDGWF
jgi:serralysin